MTNLLLAFIAGLLAVHIYFSHAVAKNGKSGGFEELWTLLALTLVGSGIFYGIASAINWIQGWGS